MDVFALIVLGSLLMVGLAMFGLGFLSRNQPIADVVDKRANERWAAQAMIEAGEVPQMVASANEYRRKKGLPELTAEDFRQMAQKEQRIAIRQAKKQRRAAGR